MRDILVTRRADVTFTQLRALKFPFRAKLMTEDGDEKFKRPASGLFHR